MKEATGEANLTIITMIFIGTILGTFYFIIPQLLNNIRIKSCCISNNGRLEGNSCIVKSWIRKNGNKYEEQETYYTRTWIDNHCR